MRSSSHPSRVVTTWHSVMGLAWMWRPDGKCCANLEPWLEISTTGMPRPRRVSSTCCGSALAIIKPSSEISAHASTSGDELCNERRIRFRLSTRDITHPSAGNAVGAPRVGRARLSRASSVRGANLMRGDASRRAGDAHSSRPRAPDCDRMRLAFTRADVAWLSSGAVAHTDTATHRHHTSSWPPRPSVQRARHIDFSTRQSPRCARGLSTLDDA